MSFFSELLSFNKGSKSQSHITTHKKTNHGKSTKNKKSHVKSSARQSSVISNHAHSPHTLHSTHVSHATHNIHGTHGTHGTKVPKAIKAIKATKPIKPAKGTKGTQGTVVPTLQLHTVHTVHTVHNTTHSAHNGHNAHTTVHAGHGGSGAQMKSEQTMQSKVQPKLSQPKSQASRSKQKFPGWQGSVLHEKYQICKEIGRGTDGIVRLCRLRKSCINKKNRNIKTSSKNKNITNEIRAMKVIDKTQVSESHLKDIYNEVNILTQLSQAKHDNIVRCYETFESNNKIYIITELLSGDTLESRIIDANKNNNSKGLSEIEVAIMFYQLLEALAFLHKFNIVHRDIKPENILFCKDNANTLKVIDFGLAGLLTKHNNYKLTRPCGTPFYVPPEVIHPKIQQYDTKADLWSAGVILYAMFCGHLPFKLKPNEPLVVLYKQILRSPISMTSPHWQIVSSEAQDLVLKLLERDPNKRVSAKEALEHPWFKKVFSKYVETQ